MPQPLVLVVEDSFLIAEVACLTLEAVGYRVGMARSATEAISFADANKPDVAIIDLMLMDGETGLDTARRLRARDCAVLLCTGFPIDLVRPHAADVGAAGVLAKPVAPEVLVDAVRVALAGKAGV